MNSLFTLNALVFHLVALAGIIAHAIKKDLRGELRVSVFSYLFQVNRKSSALMAMTAISGVSGAILAGQLSDPQVGVQVIAAWGIGYMADSTVNRQT